MPYQVWFHLPFHWGEPSSTQAFCSAVILAQAVSRGMPSASAWRSRSSWISFHAGVCMALIAPVRSVSLSFGITSPQSTPITRPKPRQASQAPTAELKENSDGMGVV
ncbi:hypothetical protein D3C78_1492120 [compost metagenome]